MLSHLITRLNNSVDIAAVVVVVVVVVVVIGGGSESCIIVLYRCIDIDVCYNSSSQSYYFKFSSSRSGRKYITSI